MGKVAMRGFIYFSILITGVVLCAFSNKYKKQRGKQKQTQLKQGIFEGMAVFAYHVLCKKKLRRARGKTLLDLMFHTPQVIKDLRTIQPGGSLECLQENYYVEKIRLFLLLFYMGNLLALCVYLSGITGGILTQGKYIEKNTYGAGDKYASMWVETEDGEYAQAVELAVSERIYTSEKLEVLYAEATAELGKLILNGNEGFDCVKEDLSLPESLSGYPFELSWESSDYVLMNHKGEILSAEIEEKGESLTLTCIFSYGEWQKEYQLPLIVYGKEKSEQELWNEKIKMALEKADAATLYGEMYVLPDEIEGKAVAWTEIKKEYSLEIMLLLGLAAVCVYFCKDQELHRKTLERNAQMLEEHPILVNRMVLYIGAGMTIKGAIFKLAMDYQKRKEQDGYYHYTYEELLFTCHEMQSGVSEGNAYESLGKRCSLQPYTRLIGLLTQSLKKGNAALLKDLQREAEEAQEERRNQARKKGEEAGTKLLLPMMMLLGIVMVIIMVPAFLSF